jgi:hypothetical protein
MKHKRDKVERPHEGGGAGRINTPNESLRGQDNEAATRDISTIDQQEGNMSNGVLGGDLGSIDREKERGENR